MKKTYDRFKILQNNILEYFSNMIKNPIINISSVTCTRFLALCFWCSVTENVYIQLQDTFMRYLENLYLLQLFFYDDWTSGCSFNFMVSNSSDECLVGMHEALSFKFHECFEHEAKEYDTNKNILTFHEIH